MKVSNPVVINALLAKNAEVEGAVSNAFDELTIKKDGRYWRIYQGSNDAGMRVFDNPESAKKFIKEKWGGGWKIRVANALESQLVNNSNHGVPAGWKVVKDGRDSWYGDYLALVQSESDPSKWTYFTSGKLGKPESKAEAEKDFKDFATRTYNSCKRKTFASNAFKNTRLVPALENEVGELPDKMNRVVKKLKGDFSYWLQRDFIDGVESLIRTIDSSISSGEGDESEVKELKAMKPKLEKYRADAKSIMANVNAI